MSEQRADRARHHAKELGDGAVGGANVLGVQEFDDFSKTRPAARGSGSRPPAPRVTRLQIAQNRVSMPWTHCTPVIVTRLRRRGDSDSSQWSRSPSGAGAIGPVTRQYRASSRLLTHAPVAQLDRAPAF